MLEKNWTLIVENGTTKLKELLKSLVVNHIYKDVIKADALNIIEETKKDLKSSSAPESLIKTTEAAMKLRFVEWYEQTTKALLFAYKKNSNPIIASTYEKITGEKLKSSKGLLIDNENIIKGTITDPGRFATTGTSGASQTFMDDYVSTVKAEMKNIADKKLVMRDSLGRKLSIRNLAEMTARFEETKKSLNNLKEQGIEIVLASSHNNASKRCEIWQGKLFILDVSTDAVLKQNVDLNYKPTPIKKVDGIDCYSLRDAMAHGFLGYNCRHRLIKYQKGMDLSRKYPNEQIEQERSLEINQRAMEREIRNCKINQTLAIDKSGRLEWINKSKIAQQRYAEYCTKNKLTMYPWRTSITKAERSLDIDYDGDGLSYGVYKNIK